MYGTCRMLCTSHTFCQGSFLPIKCLHASSTFCRRFCGGEGRKTCVIYISILHPPPPPPTIQQKHSRFESLETRELPKFYIHHITSHNPTYTEMNEDEKILVLYSELITWTGEWKWKVQTTNTIHTHTQKHVCMTQSV